jgi:hypothetical protein
MGILDDLKKEADNSRLAREQAQLRQEGLDRIYQEGTRPALLRIHNYLLELTEQLCLVDWPVVIGFEFPGIGRIDNLAQSNYRISIDSQKEPKLIELRFDCTAPEERRYNVMPKSAGDDACQFLTSQNVQFTDWAIRDANLDVIGLTIQCKLRVRVSLAFKSDLAGQGIRVTSYNFEGPGEKGFLASHRSINDDWLDKLGHYIVRKNESFGKLEISEDQRIQLRRLVEEWKNRHEHQRPDTRRDTNAQEGLLPRLGKIFGKLKI